MKGYNMDNKEHFIVPEGYFENLTSEVMSKLPEREPVKLNIVSINRQTIIRRIAIAAVGLVLIGTGATFWLGHNDSNINEINTFNINTIASNDDNITIDEAMECLHLDHHDLGEMITEEI